MSPGAYLPSIILRCVPAGLLPIKSGVYDIVWQSMMPLAAALFLLEADLRG